MHIAGLAKWRIRWEEARQIEEPVSFDTVEPNPDDMFEILDRQMAVLHLRNLLQQSHVPHQLCSVSIVTEMSSPLRTLPLLITSVLETSIPSLEEQLRTVRDKISDEYTIMQTEKNYRSFMTKYSSRIDPEGAWLAYRLLIGKIAAVLLQYA